MNTLKVVLERRPFPSPYTRVPVPTCRSLNSGFSVRIRLLSSVLPPWDQFILPYPLSSILISPMASSALLRMIIPGYLIKDILYLTCLGYLCTYVCVHYVCMHACIYKHAIYPSCSLFLSAPSTHLLLLAL